MANCGLCSWVIARGRGHTVSAVPATATQPVNDVLGLTGLGRAGDDAEMKTAKCEITNTSGVYPIYGLITLKQEVGIVTLVHIEQTRS